MASLFITQSRIERVIAAGRVVLASLVLLTVWLDPTEPARAAALVYVLMAAYLGYAIGLVPILRPAFAPAAWWPIVTHVVDLAAFALLMQFTEGAFSPYFVFLLFSLIAATLRWEWRGALYTGAAVLALFVAMALSAALTGPVSGSDLQIVISRSVALVLMTGMLTYLGASHARSLERLATLAAWSHRPVPDRDALIRDIVASAASTLDAPRLLLVWEGEEPWTDVAYWSRGRLATSREPPGSFGDLVAAPLAQHSFICLDARKPMARVLYVESDRLHWWRGSPVDHDLGERFDMRVVASWPFREDGLHGRLFCLDKADVTTEDLVYGELMAGLVASRLVQGDLLDELRRGAYAEDRLKLARDLHDGVLQSLTAAALQVQAARRLLRDDPQVADARLVELQRIVAAEHVDIRAFIEQLKPSRPEVPATAVSLGSSLADLASRIQRQWGIDVRVVFDPEPLTVPEDVGENTYLLVHEALVNAARHARATRVAVAVHRRPDRLSLAVSDDGRGFAFQGRLLLKELIDRQEGPASLRDRVAALGGDMTVESTPEGARIELELPLAGAPR